MERIPENLNFGVQLGDDIVFEILTWLPAKSLMRFRCVLKAWNTLIRCDPDFVKSHIARSHARPSATHLLFQLFITPHVLQTTHGLERFPLQLAPHHYSDTISEIITCSNHCNGLVCFYSYKDRSRVYNRSQIYYLYNVTTGEIKALPSSLINCSGHTCKMLLGFDMVMERYKLLHVLNYNSWPTVEILTLGTNSWREIELIPRKSLRKYFAGDCIFLDGILYWRKYSSNNSLNYFDFIKEKFGILSPPEHINTKPTTLWEKLPLYSPFRNRYEKCHLISDEVNKVFMKFNSDDPNLKKVATLQLEPEMSDETEYVLATSSFIGAPAILMFPNGLRFRRASSFVENIIPLSFIDEV
ncbi:putative F-box protein At5g42430 [Lycium ferocissimum]|uniref:putative F-box protein At5g42430 n=1 Tax=Lycium ferocissimum TaxID=112874 RepID=UPI002815A2BE|nr:putative F-box protein At5g42430 [Lycium ferocissimum]